MVWDSSVVEYRRAAALGQRASRPLRPPLGEAASRRLRARIDESNIDPKTMIDLIQAATGKQIVPGKTLLIIDEIQESHKALNALKYFNQEMPELAIIVAGSLLGLAVGKSGDARTGLLRLQTLHA